MTDRFRRDWRDYNHPAMNYRPPKLLRRFRAGLVLVVSAALVAGVWSGAWFVASAWIGKRVQDWVAAQRARGALAAYESLETSGFPTRITLTLAKPSFQGPLGGQQVAWRGERVVVSARPWMPWRLRLDAPGNHELSIPALNLDLAGPAQVLGADLIPGDVWPERLALDVRGLELAGAAPVRIGALTLDFRHDPSAQTGGQAVRLEARGEALRLPLRGGWGLGDEVASLDAALGVSGPVDPAKDSGPLFERVTAWRDQGGALEIERLKLRLGPLGLAAQGTAALDGALQPIAAMTARIEGLFQVLDILRQQGKVQDADAVVATMALAALSKRPDDGGAPFINLSLTVQDGKLSVGAFPILDVPPLDWGRPPAEAAPPPKDYKAVPPVL